MLVRGEIKKNPIALSKAMWDGSCWYKIYIKGEYVEPEKVVEMLKAYQDIVHCESEKFMEETLKDRKAGLSRSSSDCNGLAEVLDEIMKEVLAEGVDEEL